MNNENTEKTLKEIYEQVSTIKLGISEEISILRERNNEIINIEKHLEIIFPYYIELRLKNLKVIDKKEDLNELYKELESILKEKGDLDFLRKIKEYHNDTIKALAVERGIYTKDKKTSTKKIASEIKKQIQEKIALEKPMEIDKSIVQGGGLFSQKN